MEDERINIYLFFVTYIGIRNIETIMNAQLALISIYYHNKAKLMEISR